MPKTRKRRPARRNPTDRGKQGSKRSLLTEARGVPVGLAVAGANRHDVVLLAPTLHSMVVQRPRPTRRRPQGLCLDNACDVDWVYPLLAQFGLTAHVRGAGRRHACSSAPPVLAPGARSWSTRTAG